MFDASAEYYDLIYSTFKDYAAETETIAALLRRLNPNCRTVLDVACGTGEHVKRLAAAGFEVDGLDLSPAFVTIAHAKHPAGRFFVADMTDFHVPQRYDAVVCLFSSIGYVRTLDRVEAALRCFREHLMSGGVILVEPWFPPGVLNTTRMFHNSAEANGVRVERAAHNEVDGRLSRLHFDYDITDASGTRHVSEVHELGLFTTDEMLGAFRRVGLDVEHDQEGLTDRGLFVARPAFC
jgi:SAM-dependent methyltransferase